MQSSNGTQVSASQAIVAAIVGLAFVIQAGFVPMHLGLNDHVLPGESGEHVHTHGPFAQGSGNHHHDRRHSEPPAPESGHDPHPAADHSDQFAAPTPPPASGYTGLALASRAVTILPPDAPPPMVGDEPETCPRPPPPRDTGPSRAPPIVA